MMNAATNRASETMYPIISRREIRSTSAGDPVIKLGSLSAWQVDTMKKITGFRLLAPNWDSYNSPRISPWVIETSIVVIAKIPFENSPAPYVVPVSGGGMQFEWTKGNRELEIEITPDQSIAYLTIENGELQEEDEIQPNSIAEEVERLLSWLNTGESM